MKNFTILIILLILFMMILVGCLQSDAGVCREGETKTATCPDGGTTYLAENCVDGVWFTVQYIRDPCSPLPIPKACDALTKCPDGFECIKFENEDAPICWSDDPCGKCESGSCRVAESYPLQVFCD